MPIVVSSIGVTAARATGVLRALPTSKAASTAKHAIVSHTVLIMVQSGRPMGLPEAPERFGRLEGKPNLACGHGLEIVAKFWPAALGSRAGILQSRRLALQHPDQVNENCPWFPE